MPLKGSEHRAIAWRRPRGVSFPRLIELAISRLQQAASQPHSALARALASAVPVHRADGQARRRRLRRDGAANLVTLLSAMLANADLQRGLVAAPVADGGRWERRTWADLDWRAYGPEVPDERSTRRTERHARTAIEAGWIQVVQWRKRNQEGEWRSMPGLKLVSDKLWRLLGLYEQLKTSRKQRDRQRGQDRVRQFTGQVAPAGQARTSARSRPVPAVPAPARTQPRPPPDGGPRAPDEVAQAYLAKIAKMLGR